MDIVRYNEDLRDSGAWLHEEPEILEEQITETVEADLVVVGGGLAGIAATRQATSMGATVVLLEK